MSFSFRRWRAFARKELLHILRDTRSLILVLALPLLLLLLFGFALTLDLDRIPLVVLDCDRTPASRELLARFAGSRFFAFLGEAADYRVLEDSLQRNRALAALIIFPGYARLLAANRPAPVQLLLDGSDANTASLAQSYARAIIAAHEQHLRSRALARRTGENLLSPIDPRARLWYNPALQSRHYIVPGLIAMILMIIAALLTSLTIAREWDSGSMELLLSTPVRPAEIVLGKLAAFFLLGAADTLIAILTALLVFDTPLRGSILFLGFAAGLFLFAALGWGLLISAVARTQLLAFQLGILSSFLPSFLLSGFVYAIENMPPVVQQISRLVLARYFITILKGVFLKGVGFSLLWPEILLLAAFAAAVLLIACRKLSAEVA